jgi:flagella basal body P-ring formation protein FlgA
MRWKKSLAPQPGELDKVMSSLKQKFVVVKSSLGICMLGLAVIASAAAAPVQIESHDTIKAAAKAFILQQSDSYPSTPEVSIGRLDKRLRLPRCTTPLQSFFPNGGRNLGKTTVGVRCADEKSWTLYVSAHIKVFAEVVIASKPLARGARISRSDIEIARRDISTLRGGYHTDSDDILGMVAKRLLRAGSVIGAQHLQAPELVRRGEQVTILARGKDFQIRVQGKALESGTKGDHISVRNQSSKRVIEAKVVATGQVEISL